MPRPAFDPTPQQARALETLRRIRHDIDRHTDRFHQAIADAYNLGIPVSAIATTVYRTRKTIYSYLERLREDTQ